MGREAMLTGCSERSSGKTVSCSTTTSGKGLRSRAESSAERCSKKSERGSRPTRSYAVFGYAHGKNTMRFRISSGSSTLATNSKSRIAWPMVIPNWWA